jgi:hypothetical protein
MKPLRFPAARAGCGLVRGDLPDGALEWGGTSDLLALHLATCLACQADVGPGRSVAIAIGALASAAPHRAPVGFVESVMADLGLPTFSERHHRRAMVGWSTAGVASAVAAGAALVLARRHRPAPIG